jgi:hypothetical protein
MDEWGAEEIMKRIFTVFLIGEDNNYRIISLMELM